MNSRLRHEIGRALDRIRVFVGRYPMAKVVVPIIVLVFVASLVLRPGPVPGPSGSAPSGTTPVAQASRAGEPGSSAQPEAWEQLLLDPAAVVATLTADRESRAGIATSARFTLQSLSGTDARTLAAGITADPAIAFEVAAGGAADQVTLQPSTPLAEGQTYRLELRTPDGALGGSWAFRTERPPRIVSTLPGDFRTDVPATTGIEVTFDQDGTTGVESRFHVVPPVNGRFEQHDRTWAFVPDAPLSPATMYTVSIDAGVGLEGSGLTLEAGATFHFETAAAAGSPEVAVGFTAPMAAIRPSQQAALPISIGSGDNDRTESLVTEIYRLPGLAATLDAVARLTGPASWAVYATEAHVPTAGLTRVARLDAPVVVDVEGATILSIPLTLDPGAYLVVLPRRQEAQLVLQVSDLGAYALSTETDTIVWVNDLASVTPVSGVAVKRLDGRTLGTTDASGVARFATRPDLLPNATQPLTIDAYDEYDEWRPPDPTLISARAPDGRFIVAALGSSVGWLDGTFDNAMSQAADPHERWWLLLNTDRSQYRDTDTIHAWGLVRSRDDGSLPTNVRISLSPVDDDYGSVQGPAITSLSVRLNRSGAFAVDIPTSSLPRSWYQLDLQVGGAKADSTWIQVADIRKPSYQIDVATDRHAYRDGEPVDVTIRATFFDGTSVPATDLNVTTGDEENAAPVRVTTNRSGTAHLTLRAKFTYDRPSGWLEQGIHVTPVHPEEGEISGDASVVVFPSTAWLTGASRLSSSILRIGGTLSRVAFGAIDAAYAAGSDWSQVVAGRPLPDREVTARVVRERQVRRDLGTRYDYLEKRVIHAYEYDVVDEAVGSYRARTADDGSYHLSVPVPSNGDGYRVKLVATDVAGRDVRLDDYAYAVIDRSRTARPSYLVTPYSCGGGPQLQLGLDATAKVTLHDGDGRVASEGRFMFVVGNRGLRDAMVGNSSTYSRALRERDLPGFTIRAIQVTSQGYTTADAQVSVDLTALTVDVHLQTDRAGYAPGGHVTVQVTTLGPDGRPVAADVVVQGVDEKLFAMGAAQDADVLGQLYREVGGGFLQSFASHRIPSRPDDGGCGGAGGGREAFGDVVTAQLVRTGTDGRATVSFDLLDDLTSWHLSAMAITDGLRAGRSSVLIPVGLPFFVEAVLAPEYLVGEAPVLRVRAYGDSLHAGDDVRFTVSAPTLGLPDTTVQGKAFLAVRVPLPALPAGSHRIRIEGRGPDAGMRDILIRTVTAIPSRLAALEMTSDALTGDYVPKGGDGLTTYAVSDAGRGSLLPALLDLATISSARFDRLAAADAARSLLISEFKYDANELRDPGFEPARFQQFGIGLLPYGSEDPETSVLAALTVPGRVSMGPLTTYLRGLADAEESSRESRIMALAGLAGVGQDVLEQLRGYNSQDLTVRESLWLALGLAATGDENGARTIERALLEQHGERFGSQVRLAVGSSTEDTLNASRLLLILSARLGEAFAPEVLRYLDDHPSRERAIALERLAYVEAGLDRLPRDAGRFAWAVDGDRHEVELAAGGTFTFTVTASQRSTLRLEPLAGKLVVVASWTGGAAELPSGGGVTIQRTVTPSADAPDDRLVRVVITVALGSVPYTGCWQIRDVAPSGLVPIERSWEWPATDDEGNVIPDTIPRPYDIDGQTVLWCLSASDRHRSVTYTARVVSPGTYTWQPAVIQAVDAPELGAATKPTTYTIR
ncbi:MAG TPA: Ig-like domain-containing protein [Patescibacteria group bacterium]|nr:Ig-like domain-containing protein [Patescibacteria group bacterium]